MVVLFCARDFKVNCCNWIIKHCFYFEITEHNCIIKKYLFVLKDTEIYNLQLKTVD
jgi:hypothetical protein